MGENFSKPLYVLDGSSWVYNIFAWCMNFFIIFFLAILLFMWLELGWYTSMSMQDKLLVTWVCFLFIVLMQWAKSFVNYSRSVSASADGFKIFHWKKLLIEISTEEIEYICVYKMILWIWIWSANITYERSSFLDIQTNKTSSYNIVVSKVPYNRDFVPHFAMNSQSNYLMFQAQNWVEKWILKHFWDKVI